MSTVDTSHAAAATTSTPASTSTSSTGGETCLPTLLSTLKITIHPEIYVFATIPSSHFHGTGTGSAAFAIPLSDVLLFFREPCTTSSHAGTGTGARAETPSDDPKITLILRRETAERYAAHASTLFTLTYEFPCRLLTCDVHSSLSAVGFMAVLATRLAERGISVNPVAGFYHDHLFVPVERAGEAVEMLEGLTAG
ncbi:hypothetical protein A1O7_07165 [Cladophialophora yegresii CBS 114405]|uniref:DUF2241 domain-containing protein n=1 Tax=Cladophialophora yegresii CBS 114405 TaxID=1182544 RepID=W9VX65_9EURO|nr:uncharacterized protein A1O7_07165 [Cladophialophora yegresii CBS 114405]EXJ56821.1 hypothetical protein A1O7_07165 [Cladophialophora yegresii CBS 114405]